MRLALYPGTFDPITNGHLDVVERAAQLFDQVIVAVTTNSSKSPLFTVDERLEMIREATAGLANVGVEAFGGLLVNYAQQRGACAVVRGLRAVSDFEYEFQMAVVNRKVSAGSLATVFLMANERYTFLNSTIVKEVAQFGGDVHCFVPENVHRRMVAKYEAAKHLTSQ